MLPMTDNDLLEIEMRGVCSGEILRDLLTTVRLGQKDIDRISELRSQLAEMSKTVQRISKQKDDLLDELTVKLDPFSEDLEELADALDSVS